MSNPSPLPPPQSSLAGATTINQMPRQPPPYTDDSSSPSSSASVIIIFIIIASALIVSAAIYFFLRLLSMHFRRASVASRRRRDSSNLNSSRPQCHVAPSVLLDSLPSFTFRSVTGNHIGGGDCAVCLSKFEAEDQLRLLPLCCHAFHAACIDAWIVVNQTCPLCRSAVSSTDADVLCKTGSTGSLTRGGSFRIEIGSISRRGGVAAPVVEGAAPRSYSIGGAFDYVVDNNGYEIPVGSTTHRTGISGCASIEKESSVTIPIPEAPGEVLAAEVSGGRSWLREYMDRLASVSMSSRAMSFRSSGRFFSGSSRRSDHAAAMANADLEAYRVGEEISELFRWFSGV